MPCGRLMSHVRSNFLILYLVRQQSTSLIHFPYEFVLFAGDSKLLLTASADTTAKLWNVETGEEVFSWYALYPEICCQFYH